MTSRSAGSATGPAFEAPPIDIASNSSPDGERPIDVPALTAGLARGDEAAFHEFHRLYFNRLLRYLLVVSRGDEDLAREALQLAFVRVARHARRFDSEADFWSWLAMLARSSIRDEFRKRTRYRSLLARFLRQAPPESPARDADQVFARLLNEAIAALPPDDRALIERKYFDGERVRELADELDLTEKAMDSRLVRVRRKLKEAVLRRLQDETTD